MDHPLSCRTATSPGSYSESRSATSAMGVSHGNGHEVRPDVTEEDLDGKVAAAVFGETRGEDLTEEEDRMLPACIRLKREEEYLRVGCVQDFAWYRHQRHGTGTGNLLTGTDTTGSLI